MQKQVHVQINVLMSFSSGHGLNDVLRHLLLGGGVLTN